MRRKNSREYFNPIYIGQRLLDILNILAENDVPCIRSWSQTPPTVNYDIEGLYTYRDALERLASKGVLDLSPVGEEPIVVKLTKQGREWLKTGKIQFRDRRRSA